MHFSLQPSIDAERPLHFHFSAEQETEVQGEGTCKATQLARGEAETTQGPLGDQRCPHTKAGGTEHHLWQPDSSLRTQFKKYTEIHFFFIPNNLQLEGGKKGFKYEVDHV